jgi:hypothetical protein
LVRTKLETAGLIESILRLRRAERTADEAVRLQIEPVLDYLERLLGPTVSRAEAARSLGISQTALGRWIKKGDIAAVLTPRGRREVPLPQLLDLLEEVEGRRDKEGSLALASVIRARRRRAEAIEADRLLPRPARPRAHRAPELRSLAYHRAVADRLDERVIDDARKRLRRWREGDRIDPRWADAWEKVLRQPPSQVAKLIASDSKRARELRQSSPFAGVLTEQERRRVLDIAEERALA